MPIAELQAENVRGNVHKDLVPLFFVLWVPLAIILSAINMRSSIDIFKQFHGKPDLERKRLVAGALFPTIEACLASTPDHARILIVGFPYDEDFKLDYYLYPRLIDFKEKDSIEEIVIYCRSEGIEYYVVYDQTGKPTVEKVGL